MKQFDKVRIVQDIPEKGITKGHLGYILEVYDDNHFEVEISDRNGITLFLGALSRDFLEVVI
ncbi:DUF4926 domain-containing protein [Paenibacillus sp. BSR1-1]|uniref:DUF4926 domain-containing protein n=1 Tax=Paenibacillus sp. BSR1-1 TaxID=3020845 RepID=UPI0025AFD57E|nr:DUF4926 domain-containing protein [Paenibacillus sp. BSR1-1]MDN3015716.1 DUF4926 domain-containing protein [Paenibacillus sp. BSR1-1]